mmetsp:Transcript_55520/g.62847  ORF Transcript_55520/g.62847 Transcript_55520/m.62847 type:complete len:180 (+) Transcript_55520:129-668(+)
MTAAINILFVLLMQHWPSSSSSLLYCSAFQNIYTTTASSGGGGYNHHIHIPGQEVRSINTIGRPTGILSSSSSSFPLLYSTSLHQQQNWYDNNKDDDDDDETNNGSTADDEEKSREGEREGQATTRYSKYAPSGDAAAALDSSEFRQQLRENMTADLERRRNEDPTRGNRITEKYLESL